MTTVIIHTFSEKAREKIYINDLLKSAQSPQILIELVVLFMPRDHIRLPLKIRPKTLSKDRCDVELLLWLFSGPQVGKQLSV